MQQLIHIGNYNNIHFSVLSLTLDCRMSNVYQSNLPSWLCCIVFRGVPCRVYYFCNHRHSGRLCPIKKIETKKQNKIATFCAKLLFQTAPNLFMALWYGTQLV